uniref:Uncharacterized protein n=1 Tax=Solanum lycopersicum TaxID=4081 RepID=A0A3Q7J7M3_SOLLC
MTCHSSPIHQGEEKCKGKSMNPPERTTIRYPSLADVGQVDWPRVIIRLSLQPSIKRRQHSHVHMARRHSNICMKEIFNDMVEDFVELFMDDFSLFEKDAKGNPYQRQVTRQVPNPTSVKNFEAVSLVLAPHCEEGCRS